MPDKLKVEDIFLDALEQPVDERDRFVTSACAGDEALAIEVRVLLKAHGRVGNFLHTPIVPAPGEMPDLSEDPSIGLEIGAFQIVERIGTGGMGQVYLAKRTDGDFTQRTAVKLLRRGTYDDEALRRFRNECRVLAMLEHPNIARMIDGGVTSDGTAYIVMEYVDGVPIDQFCIENKLTIEERLDLFRNLCAAVQHAHMHSTIHRDIKPSNVLVDTKGSVKLVDFGIARVMDAADGGDTDRTQTSQLMLTPRYASPEQLRGEIVSTATDVYSLGVLLYKLLTGHMPYVVRSGSVQELIRVIDDTVPTRPSIVVDKPPADGTTTSGMTTGETNTRGLSRKLRGDLDRIILMALRKEPARRYVSAEQLAEDIRRHLRGLPVVAQPDTLGYRARKFVGRNTAAVVGGIGVFTVLVASTIVAFSLYRRAETARLTAVSARDEAQQSAKTADRVADFMAGLFEEASPERTRGEEVTAREMLDRGALRLRGELDEEPTVKARIMKTVGDVYSSIGLLDSARTYIEEAIQIERATNGDTSRELASIYRAYGDVLYDTGDYPAGNEAFLKSLDIVERLYGRDDYRVASFINRVALADRDMSLETKTEMFRRSLRLIEDHYGADDPIVAYYLVNLGSALRSRGLYEEAHVELSRALAIRRQHLDADDPIVVQSLGSLGSLLNQMKRHDEALPHLQEGLKIREKIYGASHVRTTPSLNALANTYSGLGQYAEAKKYYERALEINMATHGGEHAWVGFDNLGIGDVLLRMGRPAEARSYFEAARRIHEKAYGAEHNIVGRALAGLGRVEAALNDHEKAVSFFEHALELFATLGDDHPRFRETAEMYKVSLNALGRTSEAAQLEARIGTLAN